MKAWDSKQDVFSKKKSESQNNPDYDWHDNLVPFD